MNRDKITVNDALVSTDVDSLIKILSDKKRISLNELERLSRMDRKSMDKWIRVLEDKEYVSIAYGLTGTTIIWLGESSQAYAPDEEIDDVLASMVSRESDHKEEVLEAIKSSDHDRLDPEKRLEEYLKRKQDNVEEDELKSSILNNVHDVELKGDRFSKKSVEPLDIEGRNPEKEEEIVTDLKVSKLVQVEEENDSEIKEELLEDELDLEPIRITKPSVQTEASSKPIKDMVNSYINQINKEKAELERLKAEKDRIYRERYLSLESKVEADIASITERILEKEGRVISLKERVLTLPDKVDEIGKVHDSIKKLESDGRAVIKAAKQDVDSFVQEVARTQNEVTSRMIESKELLAAEQEKVESLITLQDDADRKILFIKETMGATQNSIEELNGSMNTLLTQLEEATEMKLGVTDMIEKVKSSIDSSESELINLEKQIEQISQVEVWAREYMEDYEQKVDQISKYVESSEDELAKLRKSAEAAYLKKYIHELEEMTSHYDVQMTEATEQEMEIEKRIEDTRERLSSLVKDSKEMISQLRSDNASTPDFDSLKAQASQRTDRILKMIQNKESERSRLVGDFGRAKSGRASTRTVPARRSAKKAVTRKSNSKRNSKKDRK